MSSFLAQLLDTLGLAPPAGPGAAPGRVESDLLLALGFLTIPAVLGRAGRRRPAPPRTVLVWAGLWAVLCGVSHLADALSCLTPLGGTAAVVKVAAAAASWVALVGVLRSLPRGVSAAESAAREADLERLRVLEAAVTASGDGVMVSEAPHGSEPGPRIVYANPAFEQMTGYLASEAVGQSPSILHDSDPGAASPETIRAALRSTEPVRVEVPNRRKDGTRVWAEWHVVPVRGAAGRFTHWVAVLRDTTERRREKNELRRTRDFLTSLLENLPAPVCVTDECGEYRLVNPAWERATGVTRAHAVGKKTRELFPPAVADEIERQAETVRATGRPLREELTLELAGDRRVFLTVSFPLSGPDGKPGAVGRVALDVTEQTRAEEAVRALNAELKRSESFLRLVWDSAADGMRLTNRDGSVLMANPAYCRLVGRPPEEVVGRPLADLHVPARRGEIRCKHDAQFDPETRRPRFETEVELWDGRRRWFEVNSALLEVPGEAPLLLAVVRDATDRRLAEEARREREELLRTILNHVPCGVFRKDRDLVYLGCNEPVARDWGLANDEEIVGRTDMDICPDPADAEFYRRCDRQVIDTGESLLNIEEAQTRPDGTVATLLTSKVPLRGAAGEIVGVLGVYQDITDRKKLEEQYRQAQKMEAVGRLAGGIAHDFNNLLTVITGYGELLRDRVAGCPETGELAEQVCRAGGRAAALTRQLLAFSRKAIVEPRTLDLNAAVGEAGKMIRRLIGEDVDLRCELAAEPAWVRADPGHLDQVILNLAVNARDAMPGGGRVTIRTAVAELTGTDDGAPAGEEVRPGPYVVLSVSDTGVGMGEEVRKHIFEPFFTTKAQGEGTGLGLATVYGIVKQGGGHIRVTSEPGRGSEFAVYLPRVDPPPAPGSAVTAPARPAVGTETLLLAEDEDGVRGFAGAALRAAGYTVLEAADGEDALRVAEAHDGPIDMLVTDLIMPHLGGRGLSEALAERVPGSRVLFLSGYTDDAVVREGVRAAEVAFLQKPFTAAALTRKVREVLDDPAA